MSEELKPCPFCGDAVAFTPYKNNGLKIRCIECGIEYRQRALRYGLEWLEGKMAETWNRRAAQAAPVPQDGERGTVPRDGGDERECLSDVVSHFDNLRAGLCAQRLAASDANDTDSVAYWNHEISVLERMKAQAQAALASNEAAAVAVENLAGWKLVPIEPTDDMEAAAEDDYEHTGATFPNWKSAYRAMLCAIPSASSPDEEYQVKSGPIMCWTTYQDRAVAQKHFDQLKADGCNAQFRIIYTAPIASAEEAVPVAWRYLTPTGWHATTKMDKALGASAHHDMEPLYAQSAAAQPSRAEVLEQAARVCEKRAEERFQELGTTEPDTGASYYSGRAAEEYGARDEEDEDCAAAIRALKDKP